jgi:hypothetical protein
MDAVVDILVDEGSQELHRAGDEDEQSELSAVTGPDPPSRFAIASWFGVMRRAAQRALHRR